ncbi:hypothetical protein BT96DRAFT_951887 [Gymnopus androsaceus JB14]|uniref:Uncharacterized protein n=1 Tax=Gymnopus androsaceus JB14 TaxID=1447944 RepID=A0A6A4GBE2_9AGAR|nr:hypothetical protein BT96DRAFT_951887 [Gymnopus androsaceus JB14]
MPTVWFMVDDTDSRLNYTGDSRGFWSPVPSMISDSETGPTYNNTLHSAIGNTSVSFHFNGYWSLDYITYESLVNPAIDGEILQVGNLDVANGTDYNMLTIGPGWGLTGPARPGGKFLPKAFQSNMTIKLNGTSLSLYGDNFGGVPNATYKVDDLDVVPFSVSSLGVNQLLFTASNLGIGEHKAVITGNGTDTAFDISYFYVTSVTKAEQQSLNSSGHLKSGVIMGAVLGTAIPIMLLTVIMAVVWTRRKSRQRALRMLAPFPFLSQTPHSVLPKQLFGRLALMLPTSKKNITVLTAGEAENNDGDRLGPQNLLTMKLEQRLVVTQEQNQQLNRRNQQLEQLTPQQQQVQAQLLTVHTDSGLRLTGEESLEEIYEVPPGYTES